MNHESANTVTISARGVSHTGAWAAALVALGLLWPTILQNQSALVETYYSSGVYPIISRALMRISSLVPFSLAEIMLYCLLLGLSIRLVSSIALALIKRVAWMRVLKLLASYALTFGILLNLFYITWGFNYLREPLYRRMALPVQARTANELAAFVEKTAAEARALRATLHEDENGAFLPEESMRSLFDDLPQAYDALGKRHAVLSGNVSRAKGVLLSKGLSWQGISGVYIGLTAEPNVNIDQPPLLMLHAAAHEMAHQLGVASENEAEFVAYLACRQSNNPNARYSTLIYALIVCGNALNQIDAERYNALTDTYGDAIWRDLADYDAYWDAFESEVMERADRRNDAYLKHNAQESGVKSYGESVDLLLAYDALYGKEQTP